MRKKRSAEEIEALVAEAKEIWGPKAAGELRKKLESE